MFASIRRYDGVADPAELGKRVRDGFVPLIRSLEGFVGYSFVDAGGGVMVSVSLFETQAAAEASNRKAEDWLKASLADMRPQAPQISVGAVVAHAEGDLPVPGPVEPRGGAERDIRH